MKALNGSPAFKYFLVLALGILLAEVIPSQLTIVYVLLSLVSFIGLVYHITKPKISFRFRKPMTMLFLIGFGLIGFLRMHKSEDLKEPKTKEQTWYFFKTDKNVSNQKWNRWEGKTYDTTGVFIGNSRMSFPINSGPNRPNELWIVKSKIDIPFGQRAPMGFDYKSYLSNRNVQYIARPKEFHKLNSSISLSFSFSIQQVITQNLQRLNQQTRVLMKALILGDKKDLDPNDKAKYSRVGIMHVLAVSGLHVGLIYNVLSLLLRILPRSARSLGKIMIIPFIWLYAAITGFSPSVSRASSMLSLLALGQIKRNSTNPINILSFVGMLLLIYDPKYIYAIGFQLSFMAVFGILIFYPKLKRRLTVSNKYFQIIIDLALVSIAAQLFTAPLAIHYFHQFPTYFLFANILIVPIATLVIQFGLLFLVLQKVKYISDLVIWVLEHLVQIMNCCISFFDTLPYSSLSGLHLNMTETIICYLMIFILVSIKNVFRSILWAMVFTLFGFIWLSSKEIQYHASDRLIIMDHGREFSIALISKNKIHFSASTSEFYRSNLTTYIDAHHLKVGQDLDEYHIADERIMEAGEYLLSENETMNSHFHKAITLSREELKNKVSIPSSIGTEYIFKLGGWIEIKL